MPPQTSIPWALVAGFLSRFTHDVRNDINSLALGLDLLNTSLGDPEALEYAGRIREQIRSAGARLRDLSLAIADPIPNREAISAREVFAIWKDQASKLGIEAEWNHTLKDEQLEVDARGITKALQELLVNAKQFGNGTGLVARAGVQGQQVVFELDEPQPCPLDPSGWGAMPFQSTLPPHYGLGLWESDRLVRASGGEIQRQWLPTGKLVTRFKFPFE